MIEIEGKYYVIDMDRLMAWITETPNSEKNVTTMTTISYPMANDEEEEEIIEKEVTENKSTLNDTMNNVRYDFARNLINSIFMAFGNDINQIVSFTTKDLSFGQKIAFNTLLYKKIIIEINKSDNE